MMLRLQKVIADCGITSRRKAEQFILDGRVTVNGELANVMGIKVDPSNDVITVDGNVIDLDSIHKEYILLNKPRGFVTTMNDPEGRKTVMDLLPMIKSRVYPVGRLDYHSEGLLLLTNDGDFANMVMHPKYEVTKVYEVKVFGHANDAILRKLRTGIEGEDGKLKPLSVRMIKFLGNKTWLEFRLNEGKNREIRRLCEATGLTVDKLKRVAIENLTIQGIAPGKHMLMSRAELMKALNLNKDGTKKSSKTEFVSNKKTAKIPRKFNSSKAKQADDNNFQQYRKENYLKTMSMLKEMKAKENHTETSQE
jgi:23S rRNA pseudouridine2605 synthase